MSILAIKNAAARAVAGLFDIPSSQIPRELDNGPAQPVYDLTRIAELASGAGDALGFAEGVGTMTHVGAGDIFAVIDVDAIVNNLAHISTHNAWLVYVGGDESIENIGVEAQAVILYPSSNAIPTGRLLLVMHSGVFSAIPTATSSVFPLIPSLAMNAPIPLPRGSVIRCASEASGAGDIRVIAMFWIGPIGSRPPGA